MDKQEHGRRLKAAMAERGLNRTDVAWHVDVKPRTVTNWTSGSTLPTLGQRERLREVLGPYDQDGDPVELAVRSSDLVKWRQDAVITEYERHRYDQAREGA